MDKIKNLVRKYVLENFLFESDENAVGFDDSFLEKGIVDSTGVMELVSYIEEEFRVSVGDDELVPDNLDSISKIATFVTRKMENAEQA